MSRRLAPILPLSGADTARFWSLVDQSGDGCWKWLGTIKMHDGRGRFYANKKLFLAPRIAWALANGREPDLFVCHSCDNPPCCNPAHLFLGTNSDNMRDAASKGRLGVQRNPSSCLFASPSFKRVRGERHGSARLTEVEVRQIKLEILRGERPMTEMARDYSVSNSSIRAIKYGRAWRHVTIDAALTAYEARR